METTTRDRRIERIERELDELTPLLSLDVSDQPKALQLIFNEFVERFEKIKDVDYKELEPRDLRMHSGEIHEILGNLKKFA